jgi:lantibiotic modifying enzyme
MSLSRREAIRAGACAAVAIPALPRFLLAEWRRAVASGALERPYLDAALRAERWLRSVAIDTAAGRTWPQTPGHSVRGRPDSFLYSGAPGVVLFYLDLYDSTRERRFLDEAVRGALQISASLPTADVKVGAAGLYAGLAGQVVVLDKVQAAADRTDLRLDATRAARLVAAAYSGEPSPNAITDIVSGTSGAGLALLGWKHLIGDEAMASARTAGDWLIHAALAAGDRKRRWLMSPTITRELPNFSHGTAGVSYFLATLAQSAGGLKYRNAAMDGARYLEGLMVPAGTAGGRLIRHNSTEQGKDLFYLSWCHGPAGTGRLWERLHRLEGKETLKWRDLENRGAEGILAEGVPEKRTAGFWNNVSQCCGNAGVAEYFLARYRRTRDASDLAHARRHADDLLKRGTIEGDSQRWVQAENRVSPAAVEAQTGWMQGAAGVGSMLLHLDAAIAGNVAPPASVLPDSPW